MITISLQSGSNGNAIYVEAAGRRLLFDAGISGRQVNVRLQHHGRNVRELDALILSHEHSDHVRGAGVVHRMFGVPLYATRATLAAARRHVDPIRQPRLFEAGECIHIDPVVIHTIPTPHDACDGVCFIVEAEGRRLGIFTDLGHCFAALAPAIESVDAMYLESNFDPEMLARGPYPDNIKARIVGDGGHLSNIDAASLLRDCRRDRLRWIALAHLSRENNTPELALEMHHRIAGNGTHLWVAGRDGVSDVYEV